jgi:hypothetical protein
MCDRAKTSFKSLQVLCNTVRGLGLASLRLTCDVVCLQVLTYVFALWFPRALVKHFKQVDVVQNQVVQFISSSFRTPRLEPLHEILANFPFKLRAHVLLLNISPRYCRVPHESAESQVLKRLNLTGEGRTTSLSRSQ